MSDETGNLIAETLRWNDGDFLSDLLVGIEIESQPESSINSTLSRCRYRIDVDADDNDDDGR